MSAKENVLNIFICDDEPNFCEIIGEVCKEVLASEGFEGNISVGYDGEAVISYNNHIDILVLDIDMPIVDGIRVKEELQKNEEETQIIFVTSHQERMKEAFGLKVFGFVDKTYLKNELQVMLTNLLKIYESYTMIEEEYKSKDILYIESVENYVRLHMKWGETILIRQKLAELEEKLNAFDFLRIHRYYLVNMREIREMHKKQVEFDKICLPISVRMQKHVKEKYKQFERKRMRYR